MRNWPAGAKDSEFALLDGVAQNTTMAKPASKVAAHVAVGNAFYEQPLNERMRTFLRLEFLYQQML